MAAAVDLAEVLTSFTEKLAEPRYIHDHALCNAEMQRSRES